VTNSGSIYQDLIDAASHGLSVLDSYTRRSPHSDRDTWRGRILSGPVRLDGCSTSPDVLLCRGRRLSWARPPWEEPHAPLGFALLFVDADLLAVAKPSGLPVLPGGHFLDHTLLCQVRRRFPGPPEPAPVHRLGRATSGIVLFARSSRARSVLFRAFRERAVQKTYRALVSGHPAADRFDVSAPIGPVPYPPTGSLHAVTPEGRPSRSRCVVLQRLSDGRSIVEVDLLTGRPHQIRIHLAAAGHPLVGDPIYVSGGRPVSAPDTAGRWPLPGDVGYHLHAGHLGFEHPAGGRRVAVDCAPPPILRVTSLDGPPGNVP
jgi:23S rRNA pseudouridine1911/1915/1917 synthase